MKKVLLTIVAGMMMAMIVPSTLYAQLKVNSNGSVSLSDSSSTVNKVFVEAGNTYSSTSTNFYSEMKTLSKPLNAAIAGNIEKGRYGTDKFVQDNNFDALLGSHSLAIQASDHTFTYKGLQYIKWSDVNYAILKSQQFDGKELIIPDSVEYEDSLLPVKYIEFEAIKSTNLEKIFIPKTVEQIWHYAACPYYNPFGNCPVLKIIEVDEGNEWLCSENGVLFNKDKTGLCAVVATKEGVYKIPETVKEIFGYAFNSCINLSEVTIPESVVSIQTGAFSGCSSLTNIIIPNNVMTIGDYTFSSTSISSIVLPPQIDEIGYGWFSSSHMNSLEIPEGIKTIGYQAFLWCSNLESITIPNSVTQIESMAFHSCTNLNYIYIPSSIKSIHADAFYNAGKKTTEIEFQEGISEIGKGWFSNCNIQSVKIPGSVRTIKNNAFSKCQNLKEVWLLPKSLISLEPNLFKDCPLERVFIEGTNVEIYSAFLKELDENVTIYVHSSVIEKFKELFSGTVLSIEGYISGIKNILKDKNSEDHLYDLQGRRLKSAPQRGVYIRNGKKVVVR